MSIFRRKMYVLMSLGLIVLTSGVCMANTVEEELYGAKITVETMQDITNENAVFVSAEGSDSSGSGAIEKPYATIGRALKGIKSGQTIYIRGGVYKEAITFNTSGKENAYITLRNYEGEEVILDHSGNSNETMIDLGGQSYIHIEGLELRNNTNKWAYGFYLGNGESNIVIKNNKIHDLYASKPSSSNSGANAIICYGERADKAISNILIEGNEVYDCNTGWCEAISITGNCEYVSVINNKVRNTGNIGIDFCGNFGYCEDASLDQPRYCVARGNIISKANSSYATSYGLYVDGGRDILFENNIIYDSQGGIEVGAEEPSDYPTQNIIVRNNLVYNNSENGITVGGYYTGGGKAKNIKLYNNTVVNNGKENGELVISIVDGLEVANNIFYQEADKPMINSEFSSKYTSNISFSHNLYYSKNGKEQTEFEMMGKVTTGFSAFQDKYEMTAMFGKPLFKDSTQNEYALISGSIGIDSGDETIDAGEVDILNNKRHQGIIDCGAYEYGDNLEVPEIPEVTPPEETEQPEVTPPEETEQPEVTPPEEDETEDIKEIIIVLNEISTIQVGDKHFLKVALESTYADQTVTFATSDRSIAKVSENGNIKAMAEGEVIITITSAYGTKYEMPLRVVENSAEVEEPETPETGDSIENPEAPEMGDNIENPEVPETGDSVEESEVGDSTEVQSLLPGFNEEAWNLISGYKQLESADAYSIKFITPTSWEGISLWGYEGLEEEQPLEIGYNQLGADNFVQIWVDGKCIVDLNSSEMTSTCFSIPKGTKNVDICIVAGKDNTVIQVDGLYVRSV